MKAEAGQLRVMPSTSPFWSFVARQWVYGLGMLKDSLVKRRMNNLNAEEKIVSGGGSDIEDTRG